MTNDDPAHMIGVARRMADFGTKDRQHPWWAVAAGVVALATIVEEGQPLAGPAQIALQVIATVFNERTGE